MEIKINDNQKLVELLKNKMSTNGGYCPCRRDRIDENKCMCKEFRDQIDDPDYEGYCHCMLYYKEK